MGEKDPENKKARPLIERVAPSFNSLVCCAFYADDRAAPSRLGSVVLVGQAGAQQWRSMERTFSRVWSAPVQRVADAALRVTVT